MLLKSTRKNWIKFIVITSLLVSGYFITIWKIFGFSTFTSRDLIVFLAISIPFLYIIFSYVLTYGTKVSADGIRHFSITKGWQFIAWDTIDDLKEDLPSHIELIVNKKRIKVPLQCFRNPQDSYMFIVEQIKLRAQVPHTTDKQ